MTNDYMFRIVFQENKYALKGLIASVLHLDPETITDITISNEIKPGQSITDKEYRMDILVLFNNSQSINLEMQLRNQGNWQHRSLAYLCREFDSLDHGDDYDDVKPSYQVGFLGFTLFEDHPEFCARYQLRNEKDGYLYTDRFNLIVIELMHEDFATEEDIAFGIDKWVRLFKAKTWEDLKMVAQDNPYMTSTLESMYISNTDRNILKVAREREEFLRSQTHKDEKLKKQAAEIKSLTSMNKSLTSENKSLTSENKSLTSENKSLTSENKSLASDNARLRKLLEDNGITP